MQQLKADFEAYLDGFSANVQEILDRFKFRNQIQTLVDADILGSLIEKFLDYSINLSPEPVLDYSGNVRLPGLDNHAMGTIFEELIRRFNEENNEEAGEHFTPRDVVRLMAELIFLPIADAIKDGTYTVYDGACGTGGMLTVAEERLRQLAAAHGKQVSVHLFGQEVQPETYAITKADLLLKGEGEEAENFVYGSTLSADGFPGRAFDFMLSNPPYGKSWKTDLERMGGKGELQDPRFVVAHAGSADLSLITRSSDGQLMFLVNKLARMKHTTPLGSRIAEVHNGSSLFTGDAGQGESNIRRWILENDWLEAIIALPLNMFYNTGIATYIWLLTNRKPAHRRGRVQLIDATTWFKPLRKNLGSKNCELSPDDLQRVVEIFLAFTETEQSKIFPNAAFGYWKVTVERPLRLHSQISLKAIKALRLASGDEDLHATLYEEFDDDICTNFNRVSAALEKRLADWGGEEEAEDDEDGGARKGLPEKTKRKLLDPKTWERDGRLATIATTVRAALGDQLFVDHNAFRDCVDAALKQTGIKIPAADLKQILRAVSWREESAPPVIARSHKIGRIEADPLQGLFAVTIEGRPAIVEYEPDPDLRDTEQVPLLEEGGIAAFIRREVLPYTPDAWIKEDATRIGYEISFTRHFYRPQPLRSLEEISADILAIEREAEGLLDGLLKGSAR